MAYDIVSELRNFEGDYHYPSGLLTRAARDIERQREVMQAIMQVLGPSAVCECQGCAWETNEALRLLNSIGIVYQPRDSLHARRRLQVHDPTVERRGNELTTIEEEVKDRPPLRELMGLSENVMVMPAWENAHDGCERCYGYYGGVPGNENSIGGCVLCDYCHADILAKRAPTGF